MLWLYCFTGKDLCIEGIDTNFCTVDFQLVTHTKISVVHYLFNNFKCNLEMDLSSKFEAVQGVSFPLYSQNYPYCDTFELSLKHLYCLNFKNNRSYPRIQIDTIAPSSFTYLIFFYILLLLVLLGFTRLDHSTLACA